MVEAVALRTFGLGGDSEIAIDERGLKTAIMLGPRRILPLSLIGARWGEAVLRSEEHTSELQSLMRISYAVFCLKKKKPDLVNRQQATVTHKSTQTRMIR